MQTNLAPSLNPIRPDAREEIPVIDLGDYIAGKPGAIDAAGAELRYALENVGFYFIVNHGVDQKLIDATFAAAERFHAQSLEDKLALKINENIVGYLPMQGSTTRHSKINPNNKPNLNEAFFVARDLPANHPDVIAGKPFRGLNLWPRNLPGFREQVLAYTAEMERLGKLLLPLYAVALDLPPDYFRAAFSDPMFTLRMSHYPKVDVIQENEFGLAPHTDTSFMTLLPENKVPGLSIRLPNGRWIDAPVLEKSFLVNGGDLMRRYTNDRFLATPHRVVNRSGVERYAIPFFMDCNDDFVMECLPTCRGADKPPRYEPITYTQYQTFYRKANYAQPAQAEGDVAGAIA
jgi:isopenicillin N synthase-like dioxygenase